ncbi:MAG: hypothetical protein JW881_16160 [Spirochaetales bacterium]|nr:hypothetical protein [Spirochaetales bacterium]
MLQIISGKFFKRKDRYKNDGKGIAFSNYCWINTIKTCIASLEPVDTSGSVASYVITYINQIEKDPSPGRVSIARIGDPEIVEQFIHLCSFGLKAFFHNDRDTVAVHCREKNLYAGNSNVPGEFTNRFLNTHIQGNINEVKQFIDFVQNVIGLKRKEYLSVMTCLKSFTHALQLIGNNIELAYSLLVYSLESLNHEYDTYNPKWEDYEIDIRTSLDEILSNLEPDIASSIRETLLSSSNLKLQRRFIDFVTSYLPDDFFITEAPVSIKTLRKSQLPNTLKNAYKMRSQYVHLLKPLHGQLKEPKLSKGDVFQWKNDVYLTLKGLLRVVHKVIWELVVKAEKTENETLQWRNELPGSIRVELHPKHWLGRHNGFKPEQAAKKLSGFLHQFENCRIRNEQLIDIHNLLELYEKLIPTAKQVYARQMLVMYYLHNVHVKPENRIKGWEVFLKSIIILLKIARLNQ